MKKGSLLLFGFLFLVVGLLVSAQGREITLEGEVIDQH